MFATHSPQLVRINIAGCKLVTDASVSELLMACKNLEYTALYATQATDKCLLTAGLEDIHCITFLEAADSLVNVVINGRRNVTYRSVSHPFSVSVLKALILSSENLQDLHLNKFDALSDKQLMKFVDISPKLRTIRLTCNPKLTSDCIMHAAYICPDLTFLEVGEMHTFNDHALTYVVTKRPKLTGLYVLNCDAISDESILAVSQHCKDLKLIHLMNCDLVSDTSVCAVIVNCVKLTDVSVQCPAITEVVLNEIGQSGLNVHSVDITGCPRISQTAIDAFQRVNGLNLKSFIYGPGDEEVSTFSPSGV
jgi:hypothetical protein